MWSSILYSDYVFHVCPNSLLDEFVKYMKRNANDVGEPEIKLVESINIDMPGMIMSTRSWQKIKIDTLEINIPSVDIENFIFNLKLARTRRLLNGEEFYYMSGYLRCVVLKKEQKDLLLSGLEQLFQENATLIEKERSKFSRAVKELEESGTILKPKPSTSNLH